MKTRRYEGQVGDNVAVGLYTDGTLTAMLRGTVSGERGGESPRVQVLVADMTAYWFSRETGEQVTAHGKAYSGHGVRRLLGPWLDTYGEHDVGGAEACRTALRRAQGAGVRDPRQRSLAECVPDLCAIFGVAPGSLRDRVAGDVGDPEDMAHNKMRPLALGAIAYLARRIDIAWAGRSGGVVSQSERALSEVRALQGVHRGTLANCRAQFAAFAGLAQDEHGRPREPRSGIGRFARDRYLEIQRTAVAGAAADRGAGGGVGD